MVCLLVRHGLAPPCSSSLRHVRSCLDNNVTVQVASSST